MSKPLIPSEWILRLVEFNRLIVGFSGGLDSTVLLHALASEPSLCDRLLAVHINHGISVNALRWQKHCEQLCLELGVDYLSQSVEFDRSANIEEGARTARYRVFSYLLKTKECLILAHHLDDQAETLLLQLFRGAGVDGLAGMTESCSFANGSLLRPFLSYSRKQLEQYADLHYLNWIEDESNEDIKYSRNYLRQIVMPLLVEKWPGVVGNLARTAAHCQQAKKNLDGLALLDSQELTSPTDRLSIESLKGLHFDRITNVLRVWLKKNQVQLPSTATFHRLIHDVLLARSDAMPKVSWGDIDVRRYQQHLYLERKNTLEWPSCIEWTQFPKPLVFADQSIYLSTRQTDLGLRIPEGALIQVRYRQGGEQFTWHSQTKQLKKLYQDWEIPPWRRGRVPLIYIDNQLAAVVGFAVSDLFFAKEDAWLIINTRAS